jgi:uncharacterized repeat protein (TIGR03803 family)
MIWRKYPKGARSSLYLTKRMLSRNQTTPAPDAPPPLVNVCGAKGIDRFKVDTSGNEKLLYSFTRGPDGGYPLWVVLARDSAGNLYGTTAGGGASGNGVVFKLDPSGNESVLHRFTGGADGSNPYAGVVLGPNGSLYGTTPFGGQTNAGVVFEIKQ